MYFGGFLMRRPGSWSTWLAFRSTITAIGAIIVAVVLNNTALPKLDAEVKGVDQKPAALAQYTAQAPRYLPLIPVPAVVFGVAAILLRPFRGPLAILAAIGSVIAIVAIVGTLITALAPLYSLPRELDMS
ncbi:MAG: hypothetical protein AMXMBFR13_39690 [Phycisphaerae bacterium]